MTFHYKVSGRNYTKNLSAGQYVNFSNNPRMTEIRIF